jgi:hypothetical protein
MIDRFWRHWFEAAKPSFLRKSHPSGAVPPASTSRVGNPNQPARSISGNVLQRPERGAILKGASPDERAIPVTLRWPHMNDISARLPRLPEKQETSVRSRSDIFGEFAPRAD